MFAQAVLVLPVVFWSGAFCNFCLRYCCYSTANFSVVAYFFGISDAHTALLYHCIVNMHSYKVMSAHNVWFHLV